MGLSKPLYDEISEAKKGPLNLITDVPGVTVGNTTIILDKIKTGVTAVMPQQDNLFLNKLPAAAHVINGFGKSTGLIQVNELGSLETPIVLTNTFSVGTAMNALVRYMLNQNKDIGDTTGTVNPVVMECNDGTISDIRAMAVKEEHVHEAIDAAGTDFAEGAVGAGTGMCCYDLKGGIGSASRQIVVDGKTFTLGALVLSNFGFLRDLEIFGCRIGAKLDAFDTTVKEIEKGSIIVVLATDLPLDHRQLTRICKRAGVGITRTGAFVGNGSGEIALAFSTANRIAHYSEKSLGTYTCISENKMDQLFRATVSVVEESVLSSLVHAETMSDRHGDVRKSLFDRIQDMQKSKPDPEVAELLQRLGFLNFR
ncbi:P1 family peptidase [Sporolactobacillus sp. STCC-11]|uniref:DmpA family aminopeptidase n=1 Tax=Sporolactobacillus caesalpiniae TaxID=3230362 RepID=UPI003399606B